MLPSSLVRPEFSATGTHDNDTTLGWYQALDQGSKDYIIAYLGDTNETMPWLLNRVALQSVAQMAVLPMQDIMGLDGNHRMNVPGTTEGNWSWSFSWDNVEHVSAERLQRLNQLYGRIEE